MVMAPLSMIAIAGIEPELAGSASALFNMMRNLGGAVGIALLQTFLTQREQFHSAILSSQVTALGQATRQRIAHLVDYFMSHGLSDSSFAYREAVVAVGRDIRHESFLLGFSDTIILQSAVLGLALVAAAFVRKTPNAPVNGGGH
jgi:DHA2 family multidrug resistance protein